MKNVTILLYILKKHDHVNYKQTIQTKKIAKVKLSSVNIKFAYHIATIFFKVIKVLIHFILFLSCIYVRKTQLQVNISVQKMLLTIQL
jgi:hypothetical protein